MATDLREENRPKINIEFDTLSRNEDSYVYSDAERTELLDTVTTSLHKSLYGYIGQPNTEETRSRVIDSVQEVVAPRGGDIMIKMFGKDKNGD